MNCIISRPHTKFEFSSFSLNLSNSTKEHKRRVVEDFIKKKSEQLFLIKVNITQLDIINMYKYLNNKKDKRIRVKL